MILKNPITICFYTFITFAFSHGLAAATVYKWTDEEGNTHFSDVPPAGTDQSDTEEINIFIGEDGYGDPDQYSIINQADRMAERRRQESEERLARKRLHLEQKRLELEQAQTLALISREQNIDEREVYRPVYGQYPGLVYGQYPGPVYGGHYPYRKRDFKRSRKAGYGFNSGLGFNSGYGYKSGHGFNSGYGYKSGHGFKFRHRYHEPKSSMPNHKRLISHPGNSSFKNFGSGAVIKF